MKKLRRKILWLFFLMDVPAPRTFWLFSSTDDILKLYERPIRMMAFHNDLLKERVEEIDNIIVEQFILIGEDK